MSRSSPFPPSLSQLPPQLNEFFLQFSSPDATTEKRVAAVERLLSGRSAAKIRAEAGKWVVDNLLPVEELVPARYEAWRAPVRDAMLFVVEHLSTKRLAPKLVEQYELPADTSAPDRLLRLIARVPGLQKVGQIIARNPHLAAPLKRALSKLENGIRDVKAEDVIEVLHAELGKKMERFGVRTSRKILSEASVSAVVRFTWINPGTGKRERGVFKVQKAHIPVFFAEDMQMLQELANFFGKHRRYGFASHLIPDTFSKVRRHLQHEVDFPGEQAALLDAARSFRSVKGVRVPKVYPELCTSMVTALSEETGLKVTTAARTMSLKHRRQLTEQLIIALVAIPLFSTEPNAIFHGDPHAGNLLYNRRTSELVLLDWALTERLSREQRRHLVLLFIAVSLRNVAAAAEEIESLAQHRPKPGSAESRKVKRTAAQFVEALPLARIPHAVDAMKLLEDVALAGVRFPSPLIMFSKVLFTLDGILHDIRGVGAVPELSIMMHALRRWLKSPRYVGSPLWPKDWLRVETSALLYCGQLGVHWESALAKKLFAGRSSAAQA